MQSGSHEGACADDGTGRAQVRWGHVLQVMPSLLSRKKLNVELGVAAPNAGMGGCVLVLEESCWVHVLCGWCDGVGAVGMRV